MPRAAKADPLTPRERVGQWLRMIRWFIEPNCTLNEIAKAMREIRKAWRLDSMRYRVTRWRKGFQPCASCGRRVSDITDAGTTIDQEGQWCARCAEERYR